MENRKNELKKKDTLSKKNLEKRPGLSTKKIAGELYGEVKETLPYGNNPDAGSKETALYYYPAKEEKKVIKYIKRITRDKNKSWVILLAVLILFAVLLSCTFLYMISSPYGIFFSGGEDKSDGISLADAMKAVNLELTERLEEIETNNPSDKVQIKGKKAAWRDVLTVFTAVYGQDNFLYTGFDEKDVEKLESIYFQMTEISYEVTEKEYEEESYTFENGKYVKKEEKRTGSVLVITLDGKNASDMGAEMMLLSDKMEIIKELESEKYDSAWSELLGISGDIVSVAASQIGNIGGEEYWSWYGYDERVPWCAIFVSWCANECGLIQDNTIPLFDNCESGIKWFENNGRFTKDTDLVSTGDLIFFDWEGDGISDHVGIVEKIEEGVIYTIEGNSNDMCKRKSYPVNSDCILGTTTLS